MKRAKKVIDFSNLVTKLDLKEAFNEHEEKHREYRDEILTKIDGVMGELQTMREENAAGEHRLRDHEERITKLESSVQSS